MTVVINGTTGVTSVNGTAGAPSMTGTDTDTGIVYGTNTLSLATGGTTAVTVDSSQNVLVGLTSNGTDTNKLRVAGANANTTAAAQFRVDNLNGQTRLSFAAYQTSNTVNFIAGGSLTNPAFVWSNNDGSQENMRLDTSGNLLVGQTSTGAPTQGIVVRGGVSNSYISIGHANGTGSGNWYADFNYNGTAIGTISQNGTTGVLYNLTSDYRLKNDPQPLTGAKEFVMALQPKKWQWWDGSGEGVGFIAHEFMEVAKYSGNGEKDAVDEDGNPVYQSIQPSSSEVMANMVAFMQEQQALITQLQADVAQLKGQA